MASAPVVGAVVTGVLPAGGFCFCFASIAFCIAGLLAAVAAWLWMRLLLSRRLQGFTGDCLGATQQLCEIAFYLGAAVALGKAAS